MTGRLISDAAASAYLLRQWLAVDAERVAGLVCWGTYTEAEALEELQSLGRLADIRCKRLDCSSDAVALDMLADELTRQRRDHRETEKAASAAILVVLLQGGSKEDAAWEAGRVARSARLPPPPAIIVAAMEHVRAHLQHGRRRAA